MAMTTVQILDQLLGQVIPGGCDYCDARQKITLAAPGLYRATTRHADDCPWYADWQASIAKAHEQAKAKQKTNTENPTTATSTSRTCSVDGCSRPESITSGGDPYCREHFHRLRQQRCAHPGCKEPMSLDWVARTGDGPRARCPIHHHPPTPPPPLDLDLDLDDEPPGEGFRSAPGGAKTVASRAHTLPSFQVSAAPTVGRPTKPKLRRELAEVAGDGSTR